MNIVAHADDDILFLSPDLLDTIDEGGCVRTVYVTAGNDGRNAAYWTKREDGAKAAYALMADRANKWTNSIITTDAGMVHMSVLKEDPRISLLFMRLPDGNHTGSGFALNDHKSIQKLWTDEIDAIEAVDHTATYTKDGLVSTLTDLIASYAPDTVSTQDYAGHYGDGDHSDHHTVAYATRIAQGNYERPHNFIGYEDYNISRKPKNVSQQAFLRKQQVFFAYAAYDPHVCDTEAVCSHLGYGSWLPRQYTLPYTITGAAVEGVALQQTTMSHIALLPPASSSLAGATTTAPTDATTFHLPFVGLDIPTLTSIVTDVSEESDMYVSSQPAVVIRGWISDNELSEATTSTV